MTAFFLANTIQNLLNFVFHALLSRSLGPGEYGGLGAILSVILVAAVPINALQLVFAKARAQASGSIGKAWRRTALVGLGVVVVGCAVSPLVSAGLHLHDAVPVLWLAAYLGLSIGSAAPQGVLLGDERFRPVAGAVLLGSLVRLGIGGLTSGTGLGLSGAVAASTLGQAVSLAVLAVALRREPRVGDELRPPWSDGALSLAALTGFAVFASVDQVVARVLLPATSSGYYVAASTLGRIALFAPGAIALVAFPKLASAGGEQARERRVVVRSVGLVAALAVAVAAVLSLLPHLAIRLLFGDGFTAAESQVPLLAAGGALLGLLELATYVHLARGSRWSQLGWAGPVAVVVVAAATRPSAHGLAVIVLCAAGATAAASLARALSRPA